MSVLYRTCYALEMYGRAVVSPASSGAYHLVYCVVSIAAIASNRAVQEGLEDKPLSDILMKKILY